MMPISVPCSRKALLTALAILYAPAAPAEEYAPGEKLALFNCGRCHVIGPRNKMGGIGSTPSFPVLRTIEDWEDRMKAFWTLRPHPSFTQIEGVTEPFPADQPAHVHPVTLTLDDVDKIVDYARTVPPADLGSDLNMR